jgi:hypothetical protein
MTEEDTRKDNHAAAAKDDAAALLGLANEFLDLWQANLLAWGTDPALFPSLPSQMPAMPPGPVTPPPAQPEKSRPAKHLPKKPQPKKPPQKKTAP